MGERGLHGGAGFGRGANVVALSVLLLVAANLRLAVTAVSPVLDHMRDEFTLTRGEAGLIATVPVLCLGVMAPAGAYLGRRQGDETALVLSLACLVVGIVIRSVDALESFTIGMFLIGMALSVCSVLVPSLIKRHMPNLAGLASALYTAMLAISAATGASVTALLVASGSTWRLALVADAVFALLALAAFGVWAQRAQRDPEGSLEARAPRHSLVRSAYAWKLAAFTGCQSFLYFSVLTWLPVVLQEQGATVAVSGAMLSVYSLLGIAGCLMVPAMLSQSNDQRLLVVLIGVGWTVGITGLWTLPDQYVVWSAELGLTQGAGITMALTLVVLKAESAEVARSLSGMVNFIGFLVAATGPLLLGVMRDGWGSWAPGFGVLLSVSIMMSALAVIIGRPSQIS